MRVDEARDDDVARRVDHLRAVGGEVAPDGRDVAALDQHVGPGLLTELVVLCQHDSAADEDAIGHGLALLLFVAGGMGDRQPDDSRRCVATSAKSRPPPSVDAAVRMSSRLTSACASRTATASPSDRDEAEILRREVQRERRRRRFGREEIRALVGDERGADGARLEDVVGTLGLDAGPLGEDETLRQRDVQPEDDGVDGELHRGAGAGWAEVEDARRERVEDGLHPREGICVAADHDRELAAFGRRGAAGDRGVEQATRRGRATSDSSDCDTCGSTVLMSSRTVPSRRPSRMPSGPR